MNPAAFCLERAAPSGSGFYYAIMFLPTAQHAPICAVESLRLELRDTLARSRDLETAQRRLAWWSDEWRQALAGRPNHPITGILAPLLSEHPRLADLPGEMAAASMALLTSLPSPTEATVERFLAQTGGYCAMLSAHVGGSPTSALLRAKALGIGRELTEMLHARRRSGLSHAWLFPRDECERFGVRESDFGARETPQTLRALLRARQIAARDLVRDALDELSTEERFWQIHSVVLAELGLAHLRRLERIRFRVSESRTGLTPLTKLLIAWRTTRRVRRPRARDDCR